MKKLKITWQRLVSDGKTCSRCKSTEKELEKALSILKKSLNPLNIKVVLEKKKISIKEFKKDPLISNQILFNEIPLENLIDGKTGQSPCCDVCATSYCRTIEIGDDVYEVIPAELIIKGGLIATSKLLTKEVNKSCCENKSMSKSSKHCCPK